MRYIQTWVVRTLHLTNVTGISDIKLLPDLAKILKDNSIFIVQAGINLAYTCLGEGPFFIKYSNRQQGIGLRLTP